MVSLATVFGSVQGWRAVRWGRPTRVGPGQSLATASPSAPSDGVAGDANLGGPPNIGRMIGVVLVLLALFVAGPIGLFVAGALWSAGFGWFASDDADRAADAQPSAS